MYTIRKGTLSDTEEIKALWKRMMNYHVSLSNQFSLDENADQFYQIYLVNSLNNPKVNYTVAYDKQETKMLGYIRGAVTLRAPIYANRKIGRISEIFVLPEFRGKGLGVSLTNKIKEWFKKKGIFDIELEVASLNHYGIEFWKNQGFYEFKTIMRNKNG